MAAPRELSPLARFIHALREEKIRFQIAGMSAAILQGVPATTLDTDIWVDLPQREYVRVLHIATRQGAQVLARTVIALSDDTMVNLLDHVDGLKSFSDENRNALKIPWLGKKVAALPAGEYHPKQKVCWSRKGFSSHPVT